MDNQEKLLSILTVPAFLWELGGGLWITFTEALIVDRSISASTSDIVSMKPSGDSDVVPALKNILTLKL